MAQGFLQFAGMRQQDIQSLTAMGGKVGNYPTNYDVPSQAPAYNIPIPGQMAAPQAAPVDPMSAPFGGADPMAPPQAPAMPMAAPAPAPMPAPLGGANPAAVEPPRDFSGMNPYQIMQSFNGVQEGQAALTDFLKTGGQNLDPTQTAWCAGIVNAAITASGGTGTNSLAARSFLEWGEPTDRPEIGDIAVFERGEPGSGQGHVGFYAGLNEDGSIKVLGGNQGDKVGYGNFSADKLLGYRKNPSEKAGYKSPKNIDELEAMYGHERSPEKDKAFRRGSMFMALSQGLSQMSHGQPIDLSDVTDMIQRRQDAARENMMRIYGERQREEELTEGRVREDEQLAAAAETRAAERQEDRANQLADLATTHANAVELANLGYTHKIAEIGAEADAELGKTGAGIARNIGIGEALLKDEDPILKRVGEAMVAGEGTLDYEEAFKEVNPNSPLVDLSTKLPQLEYQAATDRVNAVREKVDESAQGDTALRQMYELYEQNNWEIPNGPLAAAWIPGKQALDYFGLLSDDKQQVLGFQEAIQGNKFLGLGAVKLEGQQSNYDVENYLKATPGIDSASPLGNRLRMQVALGNIETKNVHADMITKYRDDNQNLKGFDAWYKNQVEIGNVPDSLITAKDLTNKVKTSNLIKNGYLKPGMLVTVKEPGTDNATLVPLSQTAYEALMRDVSQ